MVGISIDQAGGCYNLEKRPDTIIHTKTGRIAGIHENGLYQFRGIPYAEPPVGKLRWRPPQPHRRWEGVLPATTYGRIAPQSPPPQPVGAAGAPGIEESSEDCLFLNVWTPGLDAAKRPVMVWIHGGAYIMGSGSMPAYREGNPARAGDVVLVTLNYRLGVLGFLNLSEVTGGRIPATGNEGLLDQLEALRWVKENIAAFGGDPDNITLFGESAGGMCVGCLMSMPSAQGLFQKAIMQSGVGNSARSLSESVVTARDFLELGGLKAFETDRLQAWPVSELLRIQSNLPRRSVHGITPVTPVCDERVLFYPPEAAGKGWQASVKVLVGSNLDEWKLFDTPDSPLADLSEEQLLLNWTARLAGKDVRKLLAHYRGTLQRRGVTVSPYEIDSAIKTDLYYRIPSLNFLEARYSCGQECFGYLFKWRSPARGGIWGACHGLDVGFVFGTLEAAFHGSGPMAEKLSRQMQEAWISFARVGNPGCSSLGSWPSYDSRRHMMILAADCHIEAGPCEAERRIWQEI